MRPDPPKPPVFDLLLVVALILCMTATAAWGHGLSVFAWVEGERVLVESKFSGGKRPVGATVRVFDPKGKELLSGATDAQGAWAFDLPQRTALKIVIEAGMGHRGEWSLSAAEVESTTSTAVGDAVSHMHPPPPGKDTVPTVTNPVVSTAEDLDAQLRSVLADELASVTARLARLEERLNRPSFQDILGGLGYIIGLVGIGAYVQSRRSRDSQPTAGKAP